MLFAYGGTDGQRVNLVVWSQFCSNTDEIGNPLHIINECISDLQTLFRVCSSIALWMLTVPGSSRSKLELLVKVVTQTEASDCI